MTDMAGAMVDTSGLGAFEGDDVLRVAIEIPNAAGGLQEAMKFAPVVFHRGDEVFVGLRCTLAKVRFDPIKDVEGAVARIQILKAEEAVFLDGAMVAAAFQAQQANIARMKEEVERAQGISKLPGTGLVDETDEDDPEFVHARNHAAGIHRDNPNPECPACQAAMEPTGDEPDDGDPTNDQGEGDDPAPDAPTDITKARRGGKRAPAASAGEA